MSPFPVNAPLTSDRVSENSGVGKYQILCSHTDRIPRFWLNCSGHRARVSTLVVAVGVAVAVNTVASAVPAAAAAVIAVAVAVAGFCCSCCYC